MVRVHRGDLMKDRAKNNIKMLKESSKRLQIQVKKFIKEVKLDLDKNMEKMGVLSARSPSQEEVPGAREVGGQSEEKQASRKSSKSGQLERKLHPMRLQNSRSCTQESNHEEKFSPKARKDAEPG